MVLTRFHGTIQWKHALNNVIYNWFQTNATVQDCLAVTLLDTQDFCCIIEHLRGPNGQTNHVSRHHNSSNFSVDAAGWLELLERRFQGSYILTWLQNSLLSRKGKPSLSFGLFENGERSSDTKVKHSSCFVRDLKGVGKESSVWQWPFETSMPSVWNNSNPHALENQRPLNGIFAARRISQQGFEGRSFCVFGLWQDHHFGCNIFVWGEGAGGEMVEVVEGRDDDARRKTPCSFKQVNNVTLRWEINERRKPHLNFVGHKTQVGMVLRCLKTRGVEPLNTPWNQHNSRTHPETEKGSWRQTPFWELRWPTSRGSAHNSEMASFKILKCERGEQWREGFYGTNKDDNLGSPVG